MLHVDDTHDTIALALRQRDPRLARPLLIALAVSAALHLLLWAIVDVSCIRDSSSWRTLPPVTVAADIRQPMVASTRSQQGGAQLQLMRCWSQAAETPPQHSVFSAPPSLTSCWLSTEMETADFSSIEPVTLGTDPVQFALYEELPRVHIQLFGSLERLHRDPTAITVEEQIMSIPVPCYTSTARFRVQVAADEGTVFFAEPIGNIAPALEAAARKHLEKLRFNPTHTSFHVLGGEIEMCFQVGQGEQLEQVLDSLDTPSEVTP